ncbi:MAG: beta-eliminating lyase-related protein [Flavobacteriales bacterium]|nr:beta-eliminating lyase-related protein [Flavobacteriales bacterium]
MIDLRSDTVTRPTEAMLKAMVAAPTGDDVYAEDPTVNRLQSELAERFGHEAGLFCPSGTMANQIAINVHVSPGDEVICHRLSHIYNYEGGGIARNSGASVRLVDAPQGAIPPEVIQAEVNPADSHFARTALVCVEDTVNKGGGAVQSIETLAAGSDASRSAGLPFHLDGARAWNALRTTGQDWERYGQMFDSISLCLSKGLGTPAGSVLLGTRDFIQEAHRTRKVMGGGMRQVGILAAAGLHAIEHHFDRLEEDHQRAGRIGQLLSDHPSIAEVAPVETNIVIAQLSNGRSASELVEAQRKEGVLCSAFGPDKVRWVTHLDFGDDDLSRVLRALEGWE